MHKIIQCYYNSIIMYIIILICIILDWFHIFFCSRQSVRMMMSMVASSICDMIYSKKSNHIKYIQQPSLLPFGVLILKNKTSGAKVQIYYFVPASNAALYVIHSILYTNMLYTQMSFCLLLLLLAYNCLGMRNIYK